MKNSTLLIALIATLTLASCTTHSSKRPNTSENSSTSSQVTTDSQSSDSASSENTSSSLEESSDESTGQSSETKTEVSTETSQDSSSESTTETETITKPTKEVEFSIRTLQSDSIIPYSYQPSGVELDVDDLHLFANYITYDYNGSENIVLKKNYGFIRNLNPIIGLASIAIEGYSDPIISVSNDFNSDNWTKINKANNRYPINNYKYFKIEPSNKNLSFDNIKFSYVEADQTFTNPAYIIKNVDELTSANQANALITTSNEPFLNSSKWQALGYASDYSEAKRQASSSKISGFNGETDYQLEYNEDLVLDHKKHAYRIADMSYGDNGNSFRINMLDGSEGPVIYKDCAYTYADDIAAYITAFGDVPPNMQYDKNDKKSAVRDWGIYGRVNYNFYHNNASGKFSFETEVPTHRYYFNPSQNSKDYWYKYYESDYGASVGNDEPYQLTTDYYKGPYNKGSINQRGALRFVWSYSFASSAHTNKGGSKILNSYDRNVFFTSNHYNDFQQYLNYYHGWSLAFGNTVIGNGWEEYIPSNHYDKAPQIPLTSLENIKNV